MLPPQEGPPRPRRILLPLILFLATCLSTFLTHMPSGERLAIEPDPARFVIPALQYSITVMAILLAHEMGHFLQTVRYGTPASLPYFIPMPFSPIGTMGAVIVQRGRSASRIANFDIAISGPLAGLLIALPAVVWGMQHSQVVAIPPGQGLIFGDPLLFKWLIRSQFGTLPAGHDVMMHPVLFAGWVGIFITALNLIPVGQLDGGHILYALLGRRAHQVAVGIWWAAFTTVLFSAAFVSGQYSSWIVLLFLLRLMGLRHPPTLNDDMPLGRGRVILGWLTLAFIFIGFTPQPFVQN